ncbi:hypothetical protein K458DRAFT_184245 [Lentithecium fluviatile CBS 122367]|uniref:Uncharacterized protein n=1 Tax=Lentithecium fluviatile CBS 122367 TaxID=1168545 RepID=A0A6G1IE05_9PLEO|nr:hypothetical protein K458DRAFT_184245 [Lentithecium fluviatile CBS 122367]
MLPLTSHPSTSSHPHLPPPGSTISVSMQISMNVAFAIVVLFSFATSEPGCFYPDGTDAIGLSPCISNTTASHCCRDSDTCLTHGLCFSRDMGTVVRRGCTDQTWKSPQCSTACNTEKFRSGDAMLTPCGLYATGGYCCNPFETGRSCCDYRLRPSDPANL